MDITLSKSGFFPCDDKHKCSGCGLCETICPTSAISMEYDSEGFIYPVTDTGKCTACGVCKAHCPGMGSVNGNRPADVYGVFSANREDRLRSSSGGCFYLLGREVIHRGGTVYGASFDADYRVVHTRAENLGELETFRGSKYVQSDLSHVMPLLESDINKGHSVLFSGTPCQIASILKLYRDIKNLITVELICHGVTSPLLWKEYVSSLNRPNTCIASIEFRHKPSDHPSPWRPFLHRVCYGDGSEQIIQEKDFTYIKAFLKNMILRPSCYKCNVSAK